MTDELATLGLIDAADGVRSRRFSSAELTEACLRRAERLQGALNAFIHLEGECALDAARAADGALARGDVRGRLHGVPLAHKDTYYRAGRVATCGSRLRQGFVPDRTATTLERLDAAGAIDLGGLNTSDCGLNPFGLNLLTGRARNPWAPEHVTGGSSSGSGAAVAARLVFGSLGSDSGGSVRLPAAFCGVVGLKPTERRVSHYGVMPLSFTLDSPGPLARTVADCARLLGVIAGADPRDPSTSSEAVPDYERVLERSIAGRRLGVPQNYYGDGLDPEVSALVADAGDVFRALGADLIELEVPDPAPLDVLGNVIIFAEGARVHARWLRQRAADYTPITRQALEFGLSITAVRYLEAITWRAKALAAFEAAVLARVDALLTPLGPPAPAMADVEVYLQERRRLPFNLARNTKPANYLGLPALSVPCGFTYAGLPVAFQLIGRPFAEPLLFNLGHAYQAATEFHARRPPV